MKENIKNIILRDRRNGVEFTLTNSEDNNFIDLIINNSDGSKNHYIVQMPNIIESIANPLMDLKFHPKLDLIHK